MRLATFVALAWLSACAENTYGPPPNYPAFAGTQTSVRAAEVESAHDDADAPEATPDEAEDPPEDDAEGKHGEHADGEVAARPHPLDDKTDADVARAVEQDLRSLGAISLGSPNAGVLLNGVAAANVAHQRSQEGEDAVNLQLVAQRADGIEVDADPVTPCGVDCPLECVEGGQLATEGKRGAVSFGVVADLQERGINL